MYLDGGQKTSQFSEYSEIIKGNKTQRRFILQPCRWHLVVYKFECFDVCLTLTSGLLFIVALFVNCNADNVCHRMNIIKPLVLNMKGKVKKEKCLQVLKRCNRFLISFSRDKKKKRKKGRKKEKRRKLIFHLFICFCSR